MSKIDFDPIIAPLLQLAGVVILGFGSWAIQRVVAWLNLKNSAMITASLDDALQKSVTYGLQKSQSLIQKEGWDSVNVKTQAIAEASKYITDRFPDTLKAAGFDLSKPESIEKGVQGALDRAFPQAAAVASASPATPPPTTPTPSTMTDLANNANVQTFLVKIVPA